MQKKSPPMPPGNGAHQTFPSIGGHSHDSRSPSTEQVRPGVGYQISNTQFNAKGAALIYRCAHGREKTGVKRGCLDCAGAKGHLSDWAHRNLYGGLYHAEGRNNRAWGKKRSAAEIIKPRQVFGILKCGFEIGKRAFVETRWPVHYNEPELFDP